CHGLDHAPCRGPRSRDGDDSSNLRVFWPGGAAPRASLRHGRRPHLVADRAACGPREELEDELLLGGALLLRDRLEEATRERHRVLEVDLPDAALAAEAERAAGDRLA